ncbi:MAG: pyridoxal-phosphate dependent enzyme [Deltaproteobacteria bacterium]|nr:pyridoxal-phosphate dependent enzyme [Deltaproteobacteria bacterium]
MSFDKETANELVPSLQEVTENYYKIKSLLKKTPVISWEGELKDKILGSDAEIFIKLELLQYAGSFKPRGGLTVSQVLSQDEKKNGLVTVSAGNHGISLAYIAKKIGAKATVCLPASANPFRLQKIRELGAETIICEDVHKAFEKAESLKQEKGMFFFHPFEGYGMTLGHGSLALELVEQIPSGFDQIVISVGGGGLCSGVAAGLKQHPLTVGTKIIAVEPEGADALHQSLKVDKTVRLDSRWREIQNLMLTGYYLSPYKISVVSYLRHAGYTPT